MTATQHDSVALIFEYLETSYKRQIALFEKLLCLRNPLNGYLKSLLLLIYLNSKRLLCTTQFAISQSYSLLVSPNVLGLARYLY